MFMYETSGPQDSASVETTPGNLDEDTRKDREAQAVRGPGPGPSLPRQGPPGELAGGTRTAPPLAGLGQPSWFARRPPATRNESKPLKEQRPTHRVVGTSWNCKYYLLHFWDGSSALLRGKPRVFDVLGSKNEDLGVSTTLIEELTGGGTEYLMSKNQKVRKTIRTDQYIQFLVHGQNGNKKRSMSNGIQKQNKNTNKQNHIIRHAVKI